MKIGVVIHSHTGNTLGVAERVKKLLESLGHSVMLEKLEPVDEEGSIKGRFEIKNKPDLSNYETIVFGAPVWGFAPSGVMKEYLSQIPSLNGKKVICFVTQSLPFPWMGGNGSINKLKGICTEKGATIVASGIVNCTKKKREIKTLELLEKLKEVFNGLPE